MSLKNTIRSLGTLVHLRGIEVDRLQADMAAQQATRARYRANLERLEGLAEGSGPSGALAPALALNCGQYKQAVIAMVDTHRTDLGLHEANMAVSQRALSSAWAKRELLGQVLEQKKEAAGVVQQRADRKRQDDLATQAWMAGQNK
ncbi:MAG TPA: flagellar FliJ family protein [Telluria sp.]